MPSYKALLLDIEGTTTPISFVTDVLFPYAERQYSSYIHKNWSTDAFQPYKEAFAQDDRTLVGDPEALIAFVQSKHAKNEKHTAFKSLQGALWKSGYEDGSIKSLVYTDVPEAIRRLSQQGIQTYIYSSGSIPAQKLLFKYSDQGDLTGMLSGYFDTSTAGPKTSASSYAKISEDTKVASSDWLFLSDNVKEAEAAKDAGMQSWVVERPGNAELSAESRQTNKVITTFKDT
ncbi:MAG: acireductone synthase [Oxalobacteraceae bacterium]|nr:MAG: acireductone synthase [Oxalobacteraceae bacterium]